MNADLERSAVKAVETLIEHSIAPSNIDPIRVLEKLPNVLLIPFETDLPFALGDNQDAFTLVNNKDGRLQYIVIYNKGLDGFHRKLALARELGHVILEHDGSQPESVWSEEASCFAHHFLCPLQLIFPAKKVYYRPTRMSISLEMKDCMTFCSIDEMKSHVVSEKNRINSYVGNTRCFVPDDIELHRYKSADNLVGWKNCFDVILNGKKIGYCGE